MALPRNSSDPTIPIVSWIRCLCILNLLPVFWWVVSMWLVRWPAGSGMLLFVHYFFYISRYFDIYCPSFIIPLQINSKENISLPILCHRLIVYIQYVKEVLWILLLFLFHSKVVHHKGELNWYCPMPPHPWCARCEAEDIRCQPFLQDFIFQTTCLVQDIHSLLVSK